MINSYFLNKNWTFVKHKSADIWQGIKFVIINLLSLGVSIMILHLVGNIFGVNVFISKLIATVFALVVNFMGNKIWVFK